MMKKKKEYDYQMADRVRTIIWKFRDVEDSYPELSKTKSERISSPQAMYETFKFLFDHEVKEKFIVFWLSTANTIIGFEVVSEGNLNSSVVTPREVFRGAIVASCCRIMIAHNHPSGNKEPSLDDIEVTSQLLRAGKIIGVELLDHIIFTNNDYYSFRDHKII